MTVSPSTSLNISTMISICFPIARLVMDPPHSLIPIPDITPRIYCSQKPISLIYLPIPPLVVVSTFWSCLSVSRLMWGGEPGVFTRLKSCFRLCSTILGSFRCVVTLSSHSCFARPGSLYSYSLGDVASLSFCRLVEYSQWFIWSHSWCEKRTKVYFSICTIHFLFLPFLYTDQYRPLADLTLPCAPHKVSVLLAVSTLTTICFDHE